MVTKDANDVPQYRLMVGELRAWNPFHGWQPVIIPDIDMQEKLMKHRNFQGIPELETLVNMEESKQGIHAPMPDVYSQIIKYNTKYRLELSLIQIVSIIETVKNIVLDWLLKLEEDGIMGEGMSFTKKEIEQAAEKNYTVNYFYGNNTQFQQNTSHSSQNMSIETNDNNIAKITNIIALIKDNQTSFETDKYNELIKAIQNIEMELHQSKPKANILQQGIATVRNILEGISGSIIASGILYKIGQLS